MKSDARHKICVALDVSDLTEAQHIVGEIAEFVGTFKIGLQLFCKYGPEVVRSVNSLGSRVFLDLKLHDIPNTVAGAADSLSGLGVAMFNVHASGCSEMIRAAVEALRSHQKPERTLLLAVTTLTSLSERELDEELGIHETPLLFSMRLARLAREAGADGIICSARETQSMRNAFGKDFYIVNPGIRPLWAAGKDDQKRITSPTDAVRAGADLLVIGRPVVAAKDRKEAAQRILTEIDEALA